MLRSVSGLVPWQVRGHPPDGGGQHRRVHLSELSGELFDKLREHEGVDSEGLRGAEEADKADTGEGALIFGWRGLICVSVAQERLAVHGAG